MKKIIFLVFLFLTINAIFNKDKLTPNFKKLYNDHMKNFRFKKQQVQSKSSLFSVSSSNDDKIGEPQFELSKQGLKSLVQLLIPEFDTLYCKGPNTIYSNGHQLTNWTDGRGPIRDPITGQPLEGFGSVIVGHDEIVATISFLKTYVARYETQCLCGKPVVYVDSLSKSNFGSPVYPSSQDNNRVSGWRAIICATVNKNVFGPDAQVSCEDGDYNYKFDKNATCINAVATSDNEYDLPTDIANEAYSKPNADAMCNYICDKVIEQNNKIPLTPYQKYRSGIDVQPGKYFKL